MVAIRIQMETREFYFFGGEGGDFFYQVLFLWIAFCFVKYKMLLIINKKSLINHLYLLYIFTLISIFSRNIIYQKALLRIFHTKFLTKK